MYTPEKIDAGDLIEVSEVECPRCWKRYECQSIRPESISITDDGKAHCRRYQCEIHHL